MRLLGRWFSARVSLWLDSSNQNDSLILPSLCTMERRQVGAAELPFNAESRANRQLAPTPTSKEGAHLCKPPALPALPRKPERARMFFLTIWSRISGRDKTWQKERIRPHLLPFLKPNNYHIFSVSASE
ncbi:hypothetical protein Q9966_005180 [Columba livia]|nr:hypothetical protein Q9966_005180 [Columba livia]